MSKKFTWLLAGAAVTLVAGTAIAAESGKDDDKSERRVERRVIVHGGPDVKVMRMHRDPAKHAEHLKTMLQLRPNQEAALKTYLEATKPEDRVVHIQHRGDDKTTLQRLDESEKRMAERQAKMKKRNDATRAFYGQLDASQKKVFDTMPHMAGPAAHIAMMGHPMPPMPRMHMRHMPVPPAPPVPPVPPEARD